MLFCCLWCNIETSCHKHFVVVSCQLQTPPLTTSGKCHNLPQSTGAMLITPNGCSVDSMRWSQILAQNRDFCLPHLHSTPPLEGFPWEYCHDVWHKKKTRMVWLPDGEKVWVYDYSFWQNVRTWQTDGRTDTQTDTAWQHRLHLHSIARQNDCI